MIDNDERDVFAEILERGYVKVGIASDNVGFSSEQNGELVGFDIDLGQALASAIFGDPEAVEFVTQDNQERFSNVANGIVDVSANMSTNNLVSDATGGIDFSSIFIQGRAYWFVKIVAIVL